MKNEGERNIKGQIYEHEIRAIVKTYWGKQISA